MGTSKRKSVFNDILKLLAFRLNLPGYIVINLGNNVFWTSWRRYVPDSVLVKNDVQASVQGVFYLPVSANTPTDLLFAFGQTVCTEIISKRFWVGSWRNPADKTKMHHAKSLKASCQTTKIVQLGKETFHLPAIHGQVSSLPSSFPGYCVGCSTIWAIAILQCRKF